MAFDSSKTLRTLAVNGREYDYYSLRAAEEQGLAGIGRLPYTLKVVLENLLRQHAEGTATAEDIESLARGSTRAAPSARSASSLRAC